MPIVAAGGRELLKHIHRMAVVRHLCAQPGLSRADLASVIGLTKSNVSMLVRELLLEGWLVEREVIVTGDLGRRPTPLFIDPRRLLLVGADLGIDAVRTVITSLTGEVVARAEVSYATAEKSASQCIGTLAAALLEVHRQLDRTGGRIIGIGVGLPGGVDEARGFLHFAPNLGWRDVPVGASLAERLEGTALKGIPLFLQNEADVAVLGEMEFDPSQLSDPLLYLSLNHGVGAGVVVGDRLLTGSRGFAGEVGHIVLNVDGPPCSCGRHGCAEVLIGLRAMQSPAEGATALSFAEIRRRLDARDEDTVHAVREAGRYLGVLLQNLASAYDPGCIVLGGEIVDLGEELLDTALQTLREYSAAAGFEPPKVQTSRHGADSVAVGAAALARYRLTRPLIASGVNHRSHAAGQRA